MLFDELLFSASPGRFGQHQLHADFSMAAAEVTMMAMVAAAVVFVVMVAMGCGSRS